MTCWPTASPWATSYIFNKVSDNHAITAVFAKGEKPAASLTDVKSGDWFYEAVQYAVSKGIMYGSLLPASRLRLRPPGQWF